jgi:hypothetical protein
MILIYLEQRFIKYLEKTNEENDFLIVFCCFWLFWVFWGILWGDSGGGWMKWEWDCGGYCSFC